MRNLEDLTQTRRPNGDFQLPPSCDYQRPPYYDFVRGGGSGAQVQPHQWPVGKSRVLLARGKYQTLMEYTEQFFSLSTDNVKSQSMAIEWYVSGLGVRDPMQEKFCRMGDCSTIDAVITSAQTYDAYEVSNMYRRNGKDSMGRREYMKYKRSLGRNSRRKQSPTRKTISDSTLGANASCPSETNASSISDENWKIIPKKKEHRNVRMVEKPNNTPIMLDVLTWNAKERYFHLKSLLEFEKMQNQYFEDFCKTKVMWRRKPFRVINRCFVQFGCNDRARIKVSRMLTRYLSLGITELKPEPIFHYDYLPMVEHVPVAQTSFWQHTEEDFARGKTDVVHGNLFCSLRVDGKVENYPWVVEISTLACRCRKLKAGFRLKKSRTPKEFLQELFKLAYGQQHTKDIFLSYIRIEVSEDVAMQQSELSDLTFLQQFQDWRPKGPIPLVALGLTCSVTPSHYGTSIRPDAVALGFDDFSIAYDPKRILCIFAASCRRDDEAVQMIFFHKEGMATFFGLGLSFALVFLNANGEVEVEEVRENFWRQLWMTSSEQFGSLALFESSDSISCPGRGVTLSTEDAALHFGVSVEGSICIPFDIEPREASESRAGSAGNTQQIKSPDWIKALYEHMRQLITGKVPHDTEMMGAEEAKNTDVKMASISSANALHGCTRSSVPSHSDMFSPPFPFRLVDSGTEGHGKYYNNLQRLTVKVYLNPESYTFYSPSDRVDLVLGTDMGTQKFINPLTGEVIDTVDTDICVHQMRPVVTITFLFHEGGKDASKQIKTELAVDYLLNGDVEENPLKFGWYHDKLKLSFKCKVPAAVRRETKDMATEVLSKHETRFTVRGQGKETTYSLVKGMGGVVKIFGGSRNIVGAEVTLNRKRETTRSSTERQDSSIPVQLTFLEKANFSIKRVDEVAELAYMATIYPSIKQYDLWNYDDRHLACESGMMSAVQLIIQGLWSVMDSDDLHVIPNRLCEYVFTCQRNFRLEKKVVSEVARTNFLFERKKMKTVETIDDITIQQTLSRNFLINHSFSHMQRLRRPEEYMWDISRTPQAPFPVNGILS